jgi:hypothetical protein
VEYPHVIPQGKLEAKKIDKRYSLLVIRNWLLVSGYWLKDNGEG